jgi:hypothetical protein
MKMATKEQVQALRQVCEQIAQELPEPYHSQACAILDRPHWLTPWNALLDDYIIQQEAAE